MILFICVHIRFSVMEKYLHVNERTNGTLQKAMMILEEKKQKFKIIEEIGEVSKHSLFLSSVLTDVRPGNQIY